MITGFNTDVEYNGETYHVQTEDKGLESPVIVSLVYRGGTILASKRSPYHDLIKDGSVDEKVLAERLSKQHKLICAAIKAGRIEDLKRMSMKESGSFDKKLVVQRETIGQKVEAKVEATQKVETTVEKSIEKPEEIILPAEEVVTEEIIEISLDTVEDLVIEDVGIIEETILPEEAVEILNDFTEGESVSEEGLKIELLGSPEFKSGDRKVLSVLVTRGEGHQTLSNLPVTVKVLGSAFRPLIYQARTDENGLAIINLQIPHFKSGRAALLVKVLYNGEEAEIRQIIKPS